MQAKQSGNHSLPEQKLAVFEPYILEWGLVPDGQPIVTHSGQLLPVRYQGDPAMLKISHEVDEKWGGHLLGWWDGIGAARVFQYEGDALLLEQATGKQCLTEIVRRGDDDEATRILCNVANTLHCTPKPPPPDLIPLSQWFGDLEPAADKYGGVLRESAETASELLANPQDIVVLHGDLHHGNVLDFDERGWLAIDPKRLIGERGFDFANIFCNPDHDVAKVPGRLSRQVDVVAEAAAMDRIRLVQWILAWSGLSAAWFLNDDMMAEGQSELEITALAARELG
jgi:streptomycin 6-kinase